MENKFSRRQFLRQSSVAGAGVFFIGKASSFGRHKISPNEKLNIGMVGVYNRGTANLKEVSSQNIVALCDFSGAVRSFHKFDST